jgi:hypothetical protein
MYTFNINVCHIHIACISYFVMESFYKTHLDIDQNVLDF